jgi:hypothetical protein
VTAGRNADEPAPKQERSDPPRPAPKGDDAPRPPAPAADPQRAVEDARKFVGRLTHLQELQEGAEKTLLKHLDGLIALDIEMSDLTIHHNLEVVQAEEALETLRRLHDEARERQLRDIRLSQENKVLLPPIKDLIAEFKKAEEVRGRERVAALEKVMRVKAQVDFRYRHLQNKRKVLAATVERAQAQLLGLLDLPSAPEEGDRSLRALDKKLDAVLQQLQELRKGERR